MTATATICYLSMTRVRGRFPCTRPRRGEQSMRMIGRVAQVIGLTLPALAVVLELNGAITARPMLVMLLFSVACFWLGRIVEGYSQP
ncbi:MAG: hypothetical protein ACK6CT_10055 [Planctomycetia bacterium]